MYSMDSLEYAIRGLYRSGIGENSGLSADEAVEAIMQRLIQRHLI